MEHQGAQVEPGTLPPGTVVGSWRVVEVLGRGAYGTVYSAEVLEPGVTGRFALKLASRPQDSRFEREVELLRRIHHPRVPRLCGHGWWLHPGGVAFPYFVMERIDGVALYDWAAEQAPSSGQVLRVLADVAGALEATHRAGGVHRDVKGENVLVSPQGHGFLIDFGAGDFEGARTLTGELLPPGTTYYRSPQALRFQWKHRHERAAHYEPGPADDVYALGVTGYILVTGSAPECQVSLSGEASSASAPPLPPLVEPAERATVSRELNALILRMLSDEPQSRGSAGELAQALERAASRSGADKPIVSKPQERRRNRVPGTWGLAAALACSVLAACWWWHTRPTGRVTQDGDAVALGDSGPLTASTQAHRALPTGVGLDMPKKPFPGQQLHPCPEGFFVEIELTEGDKATRSCWIKGDASTANCKRKGYEYKGGCYIPAYPPFQLPQSAKP